MAADQGAALSFSPAKMLAAAKNAAGDRAVEAAGRGNHRKSREWQSIALDIDNLLRRSIEEMAK